MVGKHRVEALAVCPAGQSGEPALEPAEAAGLDDRQEQEQERNQAEPDDGRSDERCDEGVEVDREVLRAGVRGGRATAGRV
jgi:hypothetical protein